MALELAPCDLESNLYVPRPAEVVAVEPQTALETLVRFRLADGSSLGHRPGQFVQVFLPGIGEAPISICSAPEPGGTFDLCVRKIGDVTSAIHRLQPGATVGIRGPFGNGFPLETLTGWDLLIVGGGLGLVPLRSVIQYVAGHRDDFGQVTVLYGFKSPSERLFTKELEEWGTTGRLDMRLTVDRPHPDWTGHVGVITTLFPEVQVSPKHTKALVVGPPIMYQFALTECRLKGLADDNIIMSLERRMRCGVGKCGHCQINNKYVCTDGPVFTFSEVKHMWEAI
ncbi:MAG TPA: FAD/NAD(P)-binding protein [Armatimonadota bacterium]